MFSIRKYDHVSTCRFQLKWLSIRQRQSLRALIILHSIFMSPTLPTYLSHLFQYIYSSHYQNL